MVTGSVVSPFANRLDCNVMSERDVTFISNGYRLHGTLNIPSTPGPFPGAVLVSGSGPLDRNSNMKRQAITVAGDFANHLAGAGIASLRYDKRGVGESDGDYQATGFSDNVDDAAAAVDALRSEADLSSVFVVGHSEGALIATRLAAMGAPIDGAVLLAGSARSGKDILRFQAIIANDSLPTPIRLVFKLLRTNVDKLQAKRLAQLEATTTDTTRIQFIKINAKWFREFMAYNPVDDLPNVHIPMLAIAGEKDLQVPSEDLTVISDLSGGPVEVHESANLTHILRKDLEPPTLKAYKSMLASPTDPDLMTLVSDWINRTGQDHSTGPLAGDT